jgi:multidrug efflux pump subunit AcrB
MTMLCSTLRSFQRLAIVLSAVPLGWSAGRLVSGQPAGFLAILVILALIDMIAENAVIPIEQIKGERRAASEVREAVIEACPRSRPIMLAASSMVVALIPIAPIVLGGRRPLPL